MRVDVAATPWDGPVDSEAVAAVAHARPTLGEERRFRDLELQGVRDPVDDAEREGDLGQVTDRLVADPGAAKAVHVVGGDRGGAACEGAQELERGIDPGVAGDAIAKSPLDERPIAGLARVLAVADDAEFASVLVRQVGGNAPSRCSLLATGRGGHRPTTSARPTSRSP
jgi:hypothetical protein